HVDPARLLLRASPPGRVSPAHEASGCRERFAAEVATRGLELPIARSPSEVLPAEARVFATSQVLRCQSCARAGRTIAFSFRFPRAGMLSAVNCALLFRLGSSNRP